MLFPHIHTNWTHGMLTCLKNLLCFIIKNIVRQSFRNWICHRWNIPFLERWNTFESFHMWNTKPPLTVKKSHDGFQRWNELNGCNEKDKLKTDPQVLENKHFHWIMKHGRRTKFDGNWFGFGKLKKIINENKVMNINKKNDQEHCLILFVENKHGKFDFACVLCLHTNQSTVGWSGKSIELFNHNWRVWLLFGRKPSGKFAVWMNIGWCFNCWNIHARSNVWQKRRLIKRWKMIVSIASE